MERFNNKSRRKFLSTIVLSSVGVMLFGINKPISTPVETIDAIPKGCDKCDTCKVRFCKYSVRNEELRK